MNVRAKFVVEKVSYKKHWDKQRGNIATITLVPVTSGSEENKAFFDATPSGVIDLGTVNPEAAAAFELGSEYYVDFSPAPKG